MAKQLLLCGMLLPGLLEYSSQHSCAIAIKLSLHLLLIIYAYIVVVAVEGDPKASFFNSYNVEV